MEDQRAAAAIHAAISSQIFAASLVLIAFLIGYIDIKDIEYTSAKGILIFTCIGLLILSLFVAGIGLKKLRKNGSQGDWTLTGLHIYFRIQTLLNILSIFLFFIILLNSGKKTKAELFQQEIIKLERENIKYDSLIFEQGKKVSMEQKIK